MPVKKELDLSRHGGHEPPPLDDTPIEMPLNHRKPLSLQEIIARSMQIAQESALNEEFGSITDEDDFTEDDPNTLDLSQYELDDLDPEPIPSALLDPEPPPAAEDPGPPDPDPPASTPRDPATTTDPPGEEPSQ